MKLAKGAVKKVWISELCRDLILNPGSVTFYLESLRD